MFKKFLKFQLFFEGFYAKKDEILGISIVFLLCLIIFGINIWKKYDEYVNFKFTPYFDGEIIKTYEKTNKKGKKYYVMHIKTEKFLLYSTSFKPLQTNNINFKIVKQKINFKDYLKSRFYAPIYQIKQKEQIRPNALKNYILAQHESQKMKDFYGALFFAKTMQNDLRNDINHYGIAHLLAISGYHLGLIYAILFFILKHFYKFFIHRFYPYRSVHFDLGVIIFGIILIYFWQIGFVASFLRSFVMAVLGFYLLCKNIKLINFLNLFLAFLICISLFPELLFSVGFFFSCLGVFYIFLYARHFFKKTFWGVFGFEIWTFLAMTLPVLYFFPLFSLQQLFAVIITPIFVIFYPLSLFLHAINLGGIFDKWLLIFLSFKMDFTLLQIPSWMFFAYLIFSFLSIFSKKLAIFTISLNALVFLWFLIFNYCF